MTAVMSAYSQADTSSTSADSPTISEPSGTAEGDLLVALVCCDGDRTISEKTTSDWTADTNRNSSTVTSRLFYLTRGASAPGLTWTTGGPTEHWNVGIARITNHSNDGPIDVIGHTTGFSNDPSSPDATTVQNDVLVLRWFTCDAGNKVTVDTGYPTGMANEHFIEPSVNAGGVALGLADEVQAIAGSTGAAEWTNALSSSDRWFGYTVGIETATGATTRRYTIPLLGVG